MKTALMLIISIAMLAVATGLTLGTASAASMHDNFAASVDGSSLPPCPSLFKCRAL